MSARSDRDLDRLLAGGRPAGPELDRVWDGVAAELDRPGESGRARGGLRWRWWLPIAGLAPVATAAILLLVWPRADPSSALQARGPEVEAPVLESTCGQREQPCRVGEPVYLRLHPGTARGFAAVTLDLPDHSRRVLGFIDVPEGEGEALPLRLIPEPADVASGIALQVWFFPGGLRPSAAAEPASLLERFRADPAAQRSALHLHVIQP